MCWGPWQAGIKGVIRLNGRAYDRKRFTDNGLAHYDLYFPDGRCFIFPMPTPIYHATFFFLDTEGQHVNARFLSSREEISQPGIEPPISSLRFGYLSTITK